MNKKAFVNPYIIGAIIIVVGILYILSLQTKLQECNEELDLTKANCDDAIRRLEVENQQLTEELSNTKSITNSLQKDTIIPVVNISIKTSWVTFFGSLGFIILFLGIYIKPDLSVEIKEPKSKWLRGLIIVFFIVNIVICLLSLYNLIITLPLFN